MSDALFSEIERYLRIAGHTVVRLKEASYGIAATIHFQPESECAWLTIKSGDPIDAWRSRVAAVPGVKEAKVAEALPAVYREPWVMVKRPYRVTDVLAKEASGITDFFTSPSPLATSLAGGLLGAGLGYGAGTLAEQFLPSKYFEPGKLRRTLALLGGGLGVLPGVLSGSTAMGMNPERPGWGAWLSGWPNRPQDRNQPDPPPVEPPPVPRDWLKYDSYTMPKLPFNAITPIGQAQGWRAKISSAVDAALAVLGDLEVPAHFKKAAQDPDGYGLGELAQVPNIPVNQFNQVVWADPQTPIPIRTATTGLIGSASALGGGANLVSPMDIARIGIGMGSGYASGLLVGKVLGALAGLTPPAQEALQRAGTWAGVLTNVVPMVFR